MSALKLPYVVSEVREHQEPTPPGQHETGITGFLKFGSAISTKAFMFAASRSPSQKYRVHFDIDASYGKENQQEA